LFALAGGVGCNIAAVCFSFFTGVLFFATVFFMGLTGEGGDFFLVAAATVAAALALLFEAGFAAAAADDGTTFCFFRLLLFAASFLGGDESVLEFVLDTLLLLNTFF